MTINVYLAAQAVMYLPVYVAQEKGIFNTLLPDAEVKLIAADGDLDAIKKMCEDNTSVDRDSFAIAIADPNAIKNVKDARIIGALIDRLSFWGVSKSRTDCNITGINNELFDRIVHYDTNLITGHNVGLKVRDKEGISDSVTIKILGDEFKHLDDKTMIITPDILRAAQLCVAEQAHINYHFAKGDRYMLSTYITTAIITSKWCIEYSPAKTLVRIIEAIQKAKSIIYSSKQIAKEILLNMDCVRVIEGEDAKGKVAEFIIETINDDRIYPSDMNISEKQWDITTESTNLGDTKTGMLFTEVINNEIVLEAERSIADQFGITMYDTFADNLKEEKDKIITEKNKIITEKDKIIEEQKKTIEGLKNTILKKALSWLSKNWFKVLTYLCVVYLLTWGICYLMNGVWVQSQFAKTLALTVVVPILINIITSIGNNRIQENTIEQ